MATSKEVPRKQQPIARALYKFQGQSDQELSFSPGEAILLLKRVDDNWLEGELGGHIGIFPNNRVRIEVGSPSLSSESSLARSGRPCGVVINNFPGDCLGDLPLIQGQMVELLSNVGSGWSKGKIGDNIGIFPTSFIEVLVPLVTMTTSPLVTTTTTISNKPVPKPRGGKPIPKPRKSITNPTPSIDDHTHSINTDTDSTPSLNDSGHSNETPAHTINGLHFDSLSSYERHLSNLYTTMNVEEKMKTSADNLLKLCTSDEKKEKLLKTMTSHQEKVDKISKEIELVESQRETIMNQLAQSRPTTPPNPRTNAPPTNNNNNDVIQRERVTDELIDTEQSYYNELSAFCTKVLPSFKQWNEIVWSELFANIEQMSSLSNKLCTSLIKCKESGTNNEGVGGAKEQVGVVNEGVGGVFKELYNEIREVYGTYCGNHEHASQLLEKLYEDKDNVNIIKSYMDLGKPEVTSWDLHTLLIKPVQRVLKYPLLLTKLMELTPKEDTSYKVLCSCVKLSSQVAQDINEIKRRKDLLERYTGSGRDEKRINLGTMRKKMRRLTQTITQKTGLRSATTDVNYVTEETQVLSLETLLRTLQTNINSWIEEGDQLFIYRDTLMESMCDYVSSSLVLHQYKEHYQIMKEKWKNHVKTVKEEVISPVGILLSLFHDPLLLMNKRSAKLLDYDSLQHDLEKSTEWDKIPQLKEDVTLAKRTYEALNTQLLEDLPQFRDKVSTALSLILVTYLKLQISFHEDMMTTPTQFTLRTFTNETIIKTHLNSLEKVFEEYCNLLIVPSSLPLSFGLVLSGRSSRTLTSARSFEEPPLTTRPLVSRKGRSQSVMTSRPLRVSPLNSISPIYEEIPDNFVKDLIRPISPPQHNDETTPILIHKETTPPPPPLYDTPPNEDESDDSDHEYIIPPDAMTPTLSLSPLSMEDESPVKCLSPLSSSDTCNSVETMYKVLYEFNGESELELSVEEGQYVKLLCPHDTEGSDDWWLVATPTNQGYVPSVYLQLIEC